MRRIILGAIAVALSTFVAADEGVVVIEHNGREYTAETKPLPEGHGQSAFVEPSEHVSSDEKDNQGLVVHSETRQESGFSSSVYLELGNAGTLNVGGRDAPTDELEKDLNTFLKGRADILGDLEGRYFVIEGSMDGGDNRFIRFHQVLNNIELPGSMVRLSRDGEVEAIELVTTAPDDPTFDQSSLIEEKRLYSTMISALEAEHGPFREELVQEEPRYRGDYQDVDKKTIQVIYEAVYDFKRITINAHTGEIIGIHSTITHSRKECVPSENFVVYNNFGCGSTNLSSENIFEIFRTNGSCFQSHPKCSSLTKQAFMAGVTQTSSWASLAGYSGPSSYDVIYRGYFPRAITYSGNFNPVSGAIYFKFGPLHVLSAGSNLIDLQNASSPALGDSGGHEWAHAWHQSLNSAVKDSSVIFAKAFSESTADILRALSSNDHTISFVGGSRNLSAVHPWSGYVNTQNAEHNNSLPISSFFWAVTQGIGGGTSAAGTKLFMNMVMSPSAGLSVSNLRNSIRTYIYGTALTPSQRVTVCNAWLSRGMPGILCERPSKPAIYATNTGQCGYFWVNNVRLRGSLFNVNWSNVALEDEYRFYHSAQPFSGYVWTHTLNRNVTTLSPTQFITNGTWYVAVRACNESGCSDYSGAQVVNTCSPD